MRPAQEVKKLRQHIEELQIEILASNHARDRFQAVATDAVERANKSAEITRDAQARLTDASNQVWQNGRAEYAKSQGLRDRIDTLSAELAKERAGSAPCAMRLLAKERADAIAKRDEWAALASAAVDELVEVKRERDELKKLVASYNAALAAESERA